MSNKQFSKFIIVPSPRLLFQNTHSQLVWSLSNAIEFSPYIPNKALFELKTIENYSKIEKRALRKSSKLIRTIELTAEYGSRKTLTISMPSQFSKGFVSLYFTMGRTIISKAIHPEFDI